MKTFYKSIETILLNADPLEIQLKCLRDLVSKLLKTDNFKLDCIDEILTSIEASDGREWSAPDFYYDERLKFSVRMIFWPAFYENNPHEHKTWSITGVFSNFLSVNTYQLLNEPRRLKRDKTFDGEAGRVGYLLPGCIHSVKNPTHELSASIHIFNNIDYSNPEDNAIWYPAPRKYDLSKGDLERTLTVCLHVLDGINTMKSLNAIERIYNLAQISIKLLATQSMYKTNRVIGKRMLENLDGLL